MEYETKEILRQKWTRDEDKLLAEGWKFVELKNGVVLLSRLVDWITVRHLQHLDGG